jgi:hypothetical protein
MMPPFSLASKSSNAHGLQRNEGLRALLAAKENRKVEYLGDIFARLPEPPYYFDYVTNWQKDGRNDDLVRGILRIDLRGQDNAQK